MPRITTEVVQSGKTATGFVIPEEFVLGLGAGRRVPVAVTLRTHTYRTTLAPYRGVYMIPLSAENRTAADVAAGDTVELDIVVDSAPREIEVPADLAKALRGSRAAKATFDSLSFSHKREYVDWITSAKKDETRNSLVATSVKMLEEGKKSYR